MPAKRTGIDFLPREQFSTKKPRSTKEVPLENSLSLISDEAFTVSNSRATHSNDPATLNDDVQEKPLTPRENAAAALIGFKKQTLPRQRRANYHLTEELSDPTLQQSYDYRRLDRAVKWMVLLYHSNANWGLVLKEVYGENVDIDRPEVGEARRHIFETVKYYKNKTLRNMEAGSPRYRKLSAKSLPQ
jgi:hypothetical protein